MTDLLGGSVIIKVCRRIAEKIKNTAQQSILFGKRSRVEPVEHSRIAAGMNRVHPVEKAVGALGNSRILGWLYNYWSRMCAMEIRGFLLLLSPLFGLLVLRMALAGRFVVAGSLAVALALCLLLLWRQGTLAGWLKGAWLFKQFPIPAGVKRRSVYLYLACCGVLGGTVGWFMGMIYGVAAALALAVLPAVFAVPPLWMFCLLLAVLPLGGTSLCWALSMAVVVVYFFARAFQGLSGKKISGVDVLLLVFPLLCVVSAATSYARGDSFKVIVMWLGLFACVPLVRRIITTRRQLIAGLLSLTAGAVVSGIYGLYQYLSGTVNTTWTDTTMFQDLELRVYSTFANPNVYGAFLLLVIPLVAGMALHFSGWKRWLLWGVDMLLMVNMVLTYSRGCYVGIALTALMFLFYYSKKWLTCAVIVGIPAALLVMPASVMERIMSIGNMSDSSTSYRMMIYVGTLAMFAHYWFSGVGVGEKAFNAVYPYYMVSGTIAPHSHSLFFQSVVSYGIVGLCYLITLFTVYQRRVQRVQAGMSRQNRLLMLGFGSVLWGLLVQSVFDYTWYNYRVFQLFWIVIVLGFAAAEALQKKEENNG